MADDRQIRIDSARAVLDFFEANPAVKLPFELGSTEYWSIYNFNPDAFTAFLRAAQDPRVQVQDGKILATQAFGSMRVECKIDPLEINVPAEWTIKKTVEVPEIDTNKIILAAKAGA